MSTNEIITIAIAIVGTLLSLFVSFLAYRRSGRASKSDIERGLIIQRNDINDAFMRHGIKGPYAHLLKIPDDKIAEFTPKTVLLLNQLNLVQDAYQHNDTLGGDTKIKYSQWWQGVVLPWIEGDIYLKRVLQFAYKSGDLMNKEIVEFLKKTSPWVTGPDIELPG